MAIDTIKFNSNYEVDLKHIERTFVAKIKQASGPTQYATNVFVRIEGEETFPNGTTLFIQKDPMNGKRVPGACSVISQTGDFNTWQVYLAFLLRVFPGLDLSEPKINALHLYVDVPYDVSFFREHLYIARKRANVVYSSDSDSIVIGKRPIRTTAYNRARKLKLMEDLARVEVQYSNGKCPTRKLTGMNALLDFDPFEHFVLLMACRNTKDKVKELGITHSVDLHGMFNTIRHIIKGENLKSCLNNGFLMRVPEPNLSAIFKETIRKFIGDPRLADVVGDCERFIVNVENEEIEDLGHVVVKVDHDDDEVDL